MGHPSSGRSAVDEANGVIEANIIVDRLRQKQQLRAVKSCDVCHAGVALQEIVRQHFNIFNCLRLHETREFA